MKSYDVVIIGGGAAGLMCALTAGQRGRQVLVLEKSNKVGKKILMSGGGRCNFTNLYIEPDRFLSENSHFCKSALSQYTQWDFIGLVEKHNIANHEKSQGQLFCDNSSKDILQMLLDECEHGGVTIYTDCEVMSASVTDQNNYIIETSDGEFLSESLVIATGGLSIPSLGGSRYGYDFASQYGIKVLPLRAGLVPLTFTDAFQEMTNRLSGLAITARVSIEGTSFVEPILFTHRGLSGPAVLQLSSYWRESMHVEINMLPELDAFELLKSFKHTQPGSLLRILLSQHLPKKLVLELQTLWWSEYAEIAVAEMSDSILQSIAKQLNNWKVKPAGTEGYRTAEVTLGGISCDQLSSKTMECKVMPNLYFIGEVVDVTGHLGGFNFQWAWSSGYVAGRVA